MSSLATHFSAFLFLFPLGIRRLISSSSLYLRSSSSPFIFSSKPWYFSSNEPKWLHNLDLYLLPLFLPIASFSEFFFFISSLSIPNPSYRFSFFQQSALIFFFWAILLIAVIREFLDSSVHQGILFLSAGIAFFLEVSVVQNDAAFVGLAERPYRFLGCLSLVCGFACMVLALWPAAFFAEFALSCGLVFKGTWVLQTGLTLFEEGFWPKGCKRASSYGDIMSCDLVEDRLRGEALIDLLFVGHAVVVLILCFGILGLVSWRRTVGGGRGLAVFEESSDAILMRPFEFELE